jgi:hypothetical protein
MPVDLKIEEVERLIMEQWTYYRTFPETIFITSSFGCVAVSKEGLCVVDGHTDVGRELTDSETREFRREWPQLFR